jgi:hypothetical protein
VEKTTRKEVFYKQLNEAIEMVNKSCNWEIDTFGADYNPLANRDWEMDDKQLFTIIYEVLHQDKKFVDSIQFHLKEEW